MKSLLTSVLVLSLFCLVPVCFAQENDPFVSAEFEVPVLFETNVFRFQPLHPDLVVLDYEAHITSVEHIKFSRHHQAIPTWPSQQATVAQNLRGLTIHYQEFVDRERFAYAVMTKDESAVLGTVYIKPSAKEGYDAHINMWIRTSHRHLDSSLLQTVKDWVASDWPFQNPAYLGRDMSWEVWETLPDKS